MSFDSVPVTYSKPLDLARPIWGTVVPTVLCSVPSVAVAVSYKFTVLNAWVSPDTKPMSGEL